MNNIDWLRPVNGGTIVEYKGKLIELLGTRCYNHRHNIVVGIETE